MNKVNIIGAFFLGCIIVILSCSKYKDPPTTGIDDRLDRHYCNDPRAVNYNWGFPGIPDDDICIYPVDSFLGAWIFTDSVSIEGGDSIQVQTKMLQFTSTEDTVLTHMAMTGLCGPSAIYVTANKHGLASVDSLSEMMAGQFFCNETDTLTGTIIFNTDTLAAPTGILLINFSVSSTEGILHHRGTAIRQ